MKVCLILLATSLLAGCADAPAESLTDGPTPSATSLPPGSHPDSTGEAPGHPRRVEGSAAVDYALYSMLCEGLHGFGASLGEAEDIELGPPGNESRVDLTLSWTADGQLGESLRVVVLDQDGRPTEIDWIGTSPMTIALGLDDVQRGGSSLRLGLRPGSCDLPLLVGSGAFDVHFTATWA